MASIRNLEVNLGQLAAARAELARPGREAHLVGVGGVGMAGLALHLAHRGFRVTGCDASTGSRIIAWLQSSGVTVVAGHEASHISNDTGFVIRTAAVRDDAPEIRAARERGVPVYLRGTFLPAMLEGRTSVAVSGTHGKTTTSAMIAQVLAAAGRGPGFCIGGEVDALGGVAGVGEDRVMVVEADESDGTVALYSPDIAVVTNIEYDHMEHFEGEAELFECFRRFMSQARRVVYGIDDPRAAEAGGALRDGISFGFSEKARVRGTALEEEKSGVRFTVVCDGGELGRVELPVPGRHNVLNALAAVAVTMELGCGFEAVRGGLARFMPARRRFERVLDGEITVISDYAHHPTEIAALVRTALAWRRRRIVAVFQPHRFTRTRALGADFPAAFRGVDEVVLVPVYAASEEPLPGGTSDDLLRYFEKSGGTVAHSLASLTEAWDYVGPRLKAGDVLLVVGAGDVEQLAFRARDAFAHGVGGRSNV